MTEFRRATSPDSNLKPQRSPVRFFLRALACLPLGAFLLWACAALWIDVAGPTVVGGVAALGFALVCALAAWRINGFLRAYSVLFGLAVCVLLGWLQLSPQQDRHWQGDVARLPKVSRAGSELKFQNVRSFRYHDDGRVEERWVTRSYDLDELVGFDIFFSFWGPQAYGHTIASWAFADGRHLAISIETRKERSEDYSAIRGFFRQFELYYVVSDETDLVSLRARQRDEQVELYQIYTPDAGDRKMLLDYVEEINALAETPRWYNALTDNCTTTMWRHARSIGSSFPADWRLLANGYVLELAHELGTVNNTLSVAELRSQSNVTQRARMLAATAASDAEFSKGLRVGLPPRGTGL